MKSVTCFIASAPNFQRLGARRVHLDDQRAARRRVGVEGIEHGAEAGPQLASPAALRVCRRRRAIASNLATPYAERLEVAVVLVGELVVEGLPVEPGPIEHHTHGCGVVAGVADSLEHSLENPLTLRGTHQSECGSFGEDLPRLRRSPQPLPGPWLRPACPSDLPLSSIKGTGCLESGTVAVSGRSVQLGNGFL